MLDDTSKSTKAIEMSEEKVQSEDRSRVGKQVGRI